MTQVGPDDGQASQALELPEVVEDVDAFDATVPDDDLDDPVGQLQHRRRPRRPVVDDDGVRVGVGRRIILQLKVSSVVDVLAVELQPGAADAAADTDAGDGLESTSGSNSGWGF